MAITENAMASPQNEARPSSTTMIVAVSGTAAPMIPRITANAIECCDEREEGYADEVCDKMVFTHNVAPP